MLMFRFLLFFSTFLCFSGFGQAAFAYLDPGTGSMLLQLLLGGIAGGLMVVKLYWARLKQLFSGRKSDAADHAEK